MKTKILVVEDDHSLRSVLISAIEKEGHEVIGAESAESAESIIQASKFDIVLTDINLPGKDGLELIPFIHSNNPEAYIMVMTGYGTLETAVEAMKRGAQDFLRKPIVFNDLINAIRVAIENKVEPEPELVAPPKPPENQKTPYLVPKQESKLIAGSRAMKDLLEQVRTVAPYNISVLIAGETGTGKELIANEIHATSNRAGKPFVALNCAAIPDNLLEDELFGHVKGAYTGAETNRIGRFEEADGGSLFLDEIGDMNLALQAKLLRVLQEQKFERLGANGAIEVDVRVLAATSANLKEKMEDGSFRADLYHRLNVVELKVPPLRERRDGIIPIAQGLLNRFCEKSGLPIKEIDEETKEVLLSAEYPGNVRQLKNAMERAAVFSGAGPLEGRASSRRIARAK